MTGRPGPVVLSLCPGCQARLAEHDDAEPRVWLRASAANTLLRLADPRVSPPTDARSVAAEEFLAEVGAAAWADVLRLHHREFVLPELLGMDPGEDDDQPPRPVDFSRLLWPMCAPPASALGWATRRPSRWSAYQP